MRPGTIYCKTGVTLYLALAATTWAQQGPGAPGQYAGPNVLSRWSRMQGAGPGGPTNLRGFLHASYGFLDGFTGPVTDFSIGGAVPRKASNSLVGGGGLSLNRLDSRGLLTLSYMGNYTYTRTADSYRGWNQDLNLNYERQLTRRWGFYTGESAGTQSSILGLARPTTQRNFFDQSYSVSSEALDARLKFVNVGAGLFFRKSSRLHFSMDGGAFLVSRDSRALVSSRGERAQGEMAYRFSKKQSVGAVYSFSHFYFIRGFGESFVNSIQLTYTLQLGRYWNLSASAGPYQADSERLRTVSVDPYITALTGQRSTLEVFQGSQRGIGTNVVASGRYRHQNITIGYRRAVDPGNGITLTAINDMAQATYSYDINRSISTGASVFSTRLNPLLTSSERNADFRSYGANYNLSYRLTNTIHAIGNVGVHSVSYSEIGFKQFRKSATVGLAFSPRELPLR